MVNNEPTQCLLMSFVPKLQCILRSHPTNGDETCSLARNKLLQYHAFHRLPSKDWLQYGGFPMNVLS